MSEPAIVLGPGGYPGYTLASMIDLVRRVLPPQQAQFTEADITGVGLTRQELVERVRRSVRDANARFILDEEITDWLNEALLDVAARTKAIRTTISGNTAAGGIINLPADFLSVLELKLGANFVQEVGDDQEWQDWSEGGGAPGQYRYRIRGAVAEISPNPGAGGAYTLTYAQRPSLLTVDADTTNLPLALTTRVVRYAQAYAKLKDGDSGSFDRYMAWYEQDLPPLEQLLQADPRAKLGPRTPSDYEIADAINDWLLQLAWRLPSVERTDNDVTDGAGRIAVPSDYLKSVSLRIGTMNARWADEDTFNDYVDHSRSVPSDLLLARIWAGFIETYPVQTVGVDFEHRYYARPLTLVAMTDVADVPLEIQKKAIDGARYEALMSMASSPGDLQRADRYYARAVEGLPATGVVQERFDPGPISLVPESSPFDWDNRAAHL